MSGITRPMLAGKIDTLEEVQLPCYASNKLDGIRCLLIPNSEGGVSAVSRNFRPIANNATRIWLETNLFSGLDGELMVSNEGKNAEFEQVSSSIMSQDGIPNFVYHIFDYVRTNLDKPFSERLEDLKAAIAKLPKSCMEHIKIVQQVRIDNVAALEAYLNECLSKGFEGVVVRSLGSPYKNGRSTSRESYMMKIKTFLDSEAEIIDTIEKMHNSNEPTTDKLGYTERSQAKGGMEPLGTLGAFQVRDIKSGAEFFIGTGMNDEQRTKFWADREKMVGQIIKYKFQNIGSGGLPRFPVYLGFRSKADMDA